MKIASTPFRSRTARRCAGLLTLVLVFLNLLGPLSLHAEGSRTLYRSGATGSRANLEWRSNTYGNGLLLRRTLVKVYAVQGESILLGSSAVGVNNGDILLFNSGRVTGAIGQETVPATANFSCVTQRTTPGAPPNQGRISSRAQELAGPNTLPTASVPNGYTPCYYTAPATGVYDVVFYGPIGANSSADSSPTGEIALSSATNFDATQGTSVAAWDVTVRSNLANAATNQSGRVFTYYLAAYTGGNGRPVNSTMYAVTMDGFRYQIDLRGLDPNGFLLFGNQLGFLDSDGQTPLYRDAIGNNGQLDTLQGGVSFARPTFPLFFETPSTATIAAINIPLTPVRPVVTAASYAGNVGGNTSTVGRGGAFTYTSNVAGVYEIIISRDGVNFDPTSPQNRVLRGARPAGTQTVTWNGQDNNGADFPVGTNYRVRTSVHAGEYHFPLIDAENSTLGGPSFLLLNPPDGACPPLTGFCRGAFYDDRSYRTLNGTIVDPRVPSEPPQVNRVLCGSNPPATPNSDPLLGYDSATSRRAYGANPGSNTNATCTGSFGDAKGLDFWTYYPSTPTSTSLNITSTAADLSVTKTGPATQVQPGQDLTYTIAVRNDGPDAAINTFMNDPLPANTTFRSLVSPAGWSCSAPAVGEPGTVDCRNPSFAANTTATFTLVVRLDADAPGSSPIPNRVITGSDTPDGDTDDREATTTTTVASIPGLALSKTDGDVQTAPGNVVPYVLTYRNSGNVALSGVVLTEQVPANSTFNAGSSSPGWSCADGASAGATCTLSVGTLGIGASGTATFAVLVNNPVPAGTTEITNAATVSASDGTSATAGDVTPVQTTPGLSLNKSDGGVTTAPDATLPYVLSYANTGNVGLTGVAIADQVPANARFHAAASTPGWSCADGAPAGTTCTWTIGDLSGGASGEIIFAVAVNSPFPAGVTQIANAATVTANGGTSAAGNDSTPVQTSPGLQITKTDGGIATTPGSTVIYTLNYANTGNVDLTGVTLADVVPDNTTFNRNASTGGWSCGDGAPAGTACTYNVGNLAGGATGSVQFAVNLITPFPAGITQIANAVTIADASGTTATNSDTTPVTTSPSLSLDKSDGGVTTIPGGAVRYTLGYANTGNVDLTGVVLTETVPANTTFDAAASTAGWSCANGSPAGTPCNLTVGNLSGGATGSTFFAGLVANPVPAGVAQIVNGASIADGNGTSATANDTTPVQTTPGLSITKSDGGAATTPGGTVVYTLNYANTGNVGLTGVVLSDQVPANTTFNAASSTAGWSCANGAAAGTSCTYLVGTLAGGASGSVSFAVTVSNPVPASTTEVTNAVRISADGGTTAFNSDSTPINVTRGIDLTKSDAGITTTPGGTVAYTLSYANTGNIGLTGVTLTEIVPSNTTFNARRSTAGWSCADGGSAGTACTFAIGSLAGGTTASIIFAVTVNFPVPAGVTEVTNTATIADDSGTTDSSSDVTPVQTRPGLAIIKSDGGVTTTPGGTISYVVSYGNTGNIGLTGVVITEQVPAHTTFNAGASTQGWNCADGAPAGTACTYLVGNLAGGGAGGFVTFAVTVRNPFAARVRAIANSATISADNGTTATGSDTTPVQTTPMLTLSKSDGGTTTTPGGSVAYTLAYTNTGDVDMTGVVITEQVPTNATFNAATSTPGWSCPGGSAAGATCTFTIGNLAAGAGSNVVFGVTVVNPLPAGVSQLTNAATIADDAGTTASGTDTTPVQTTPGLQITKSDGGTTTQPGGTVVYTLAYTNTGNVGLNGVTLTEVVPANTRFNAGASTAGWSCADNSPANTTCALAVGSVAGGANGTARFAVTVVNPLPSTVAQVTNAVVITDASGARAENSDTTPILVAPDLQISKSDGGVSTVPNGVVIYTLRYTNTGNVDLTGVVIAEVVPDNTQFDTGASTQGWSCADGSPAGATCNFAVGNVASRASGSVTFAVAVAGQLPAGVSQVSNTANIAADGVSGPDVTPADNASSDTTPIAAAPDLTLAKSDGGITTLPGRLITYTLSYSNGGSQAATGVVIADTVPPHTRFNLAGSTPGWSCTDGAPAGSVCIIPVGSLAVAATGSVQFVVTVSDPIPAGVSQIDNAAAIADDGTNGPDPTPADNSASDSTPLDTTAITLLSFTATSEGSGVTVRWTTSAEVNTWGYHLYRSTDGQRASAVRVTPTMILAQGRGRGGASYTWKDGNTTAGTTYSYWLEEIELDQTTHGYGPVQVTHTPDGTIAGGYRIFLPVVRH